ncbi:proteasome inhibitor PI31 subunit [Synchiropus picturatus]
MAGLEVLYTCVGDSVTCPQDALICFVHWEIITAGFKCLGSGDEPGPGDRKSELLPADWNSNKELYVLRYQEKNGDDRLLLKSLVMDSNLIFLLMNGASKQVGDFTVNVSDHVDSEHLHTFDRVYKDVDSLSEKVRKLLPASTRTSQPEEQQREGRRGNSDLQCIPSRRPRPGTQPDRFDPLANPFAAGGLDLDPFGSRGGGGMIVDPLRSGYPRSGFDPSSGIPDILPPGAVPPGARFDPFGPVGPNRQSRPGPDPDHLPPPGYDDMFM